MFDTRNDLPANVRVEVTEILSLEAHLHAKR